MKIKTNILCPVFAVIALACFAFAQNTQAVSPAPDGGYQGGNTAEGQNALFSLTTGGFNTAVGHLSLRSDTTGSFNTALGAGTLLANTGDQNSATGAGALLSNTTGNVNTANGAFALFSNTTGSNNTATGYNALSNNTTGTWNTAIGVNALGFSTGDFNIALGHNAGLNPTNCIHNIHIGNPGLANDSTTIRIGQNGDQTKTFIAGIFGVNEGGTPAAVYISEQGQLGTVPSSRRFKKEIKSMGETSEAILCLKPVTFHYKSDPAGAGPQFGLIAEEVAEVNPDLVVRDKSGEIYSVRYDAVNAMLLNEFLKEHGKVEEQSRKLQEQETTIAQLKQDFQSKFAEQQKDFRATVAQLSAHLEEQDSKIQRVSAQVEMSKFATGRIRRGGPAPKIVLNNQ